MKYSFNTFNHSTYYGLEPTLPAQIAAAAAAGYDHIGLDVFSVRAHDRAGTPPEALADVLRAAELSCYEIVSLSISADRDATERSLAGILRYAPIVGAREVLTVVTGPIDAAVAANARHCAAALADAGLGLNLEFLPTRDIDSIDEARRLVDLLPDGALKLVVEAWHFFRGPSTWESLRDLPLDLVGFVQFSDAPAPIHDDHHTESMHRRALPGEGVLDLPAFCGALLDKGYDGVVSVELLDDTWRAAPLPDFAEATLRTTRKVWEAAART